MQPREIVAGRFEIDRLAGTGGMGAVYRAIDRQTGQIVALKVLHGHTGDHAERFAREARLLSELRHPGIVRFVGSGVTQRGDGFIVMEWLEGESLSERLRRGPFSVPEVLAMAARVADALKIAHERGIVHRDLKPQNLFLEGGAIERIKVLDFGIARILDPGQKLTMTGAMLGTPGYMSPEQARGDKEVDARTDVYALGCVMFRALTGRRVFEGEDAVSMLVKTATEAAPRASAVTAGVPQPIDDLLARMLAMSPAERPRDAAALVAELAVLGGFQQGGTALVQPPSAHTAQPPSAHTAQPQSFPMGGAHATGRIPAQPPASAYGPQPGMQAAGSYAAAPPAGGYGPPPAGGYGMPQGMGPTWSPSPALGMAPTYVGAHPPPAGPTGVPYPAPGVPAPGGPARGGSTMVLAGVVGGLFVLVLVLGVAVYVLFLRQSPAASTSPVGGGPAAAGFCPGEKCIAREISNASHADAITILPQVRDVARDIDPAANLIMLLVITSNNDGTVDLNNPKNFLHYHFQPPQKVGRFYIWVTANRMIVSHTPSQAITMNPLQDPSCNAAAAFRAALPGGRPLPDNPTTMQLIDPGPPNGPMWNISSEGASAIVDPRTCTVKRF